jgi:hypothetical protein
MLGELSTRLVKIIEQKRLKSKLKQDLQALETELGDTSARFADLSAQLEKENVDVKKLEGMSLTALFHWALGSREEQLEKERQELLSAQLRYGQTKRQLELLQDEKRSLSARLDELAGVEAEYQALLSEKEGLLRQSEQAVARELIAFSEQIAHLSAERRELSEATAAGKESLLGLEQVIESLESAGNWGTWDMIGGGLISTAIKHSRIDEARKGIEAVEAKMSQFKRELADVRKHIDLQIDISELAYFADLFFDGLITDWIVQSRIEDSRRQAEAAKDTIARALRELESLQAQTEARLHDVREKRERLLERT